MGLKIELVTNIELQQIKSASFSSFSASLVGDFLVGVFFPFSTTLALLASFPGDLEAVAAGTSVPTFGDLTSPLGETFASTLVGVFGATTLAASVLDSSLTGLVTTSFLAVFSPSFASGFSFTATASTFFSASSPLLALLFFLSLLGLGNSPSPSSLLALLSTFIFLMAGVRPVPASASLGTAFTAVVGSSVFFPLESVSLPLVSLLDTSLSASPRSLSCSLALAIFSAGELTGTQMGI